MNHTRRVFLASTLTTLTAATAGCTSDSSSSDPDSETQRSFDSESSGAPTPAAQLHMSAMEDGAIGRHRTRSTRELLEKGQRVVERAARNGSTTIDDQTPPIWETERPWLYDGSVYRLSYEKRNERPATRYFWEFSPVKQANEDDIVRFEDLPRLDREKFRWIGFGDDAVDDDTRLDRGSTFVYANTDRNWSALVPTPDRSVIEWQSGSRVRFSIRDLNSKDATLKTYRYTANQLAPTAAAFGKQLRDQYSFELSGLTDAERTLVKRAIERGYTVEQGESPSDTFRSLVDAFQQHEAVSRSGPEWEYLTTYDGRVYWAQLIHESRDGKGTTTAGKTATERGK